MNIFLGVATNQIFVAARIQDFFSYSKKKIIVPRKIIIAARKNLLCHYIKENYPGIRKHLCG